MAILITVRKVAHNIEKEKLPPGIKGLRKYLNPSLIMSFVSKYTCMSFHEQPLLVSSFVCVHVCYLTCIFLLSANEFGWSNAFEMKVSKPVLLAACHVPKSLYSYFPSYNGDFFSKRQHVFALCVCLCVCVCVCVCVFIFFHRKGLFHQQDVKETLKRECFKVFSIG